MSDADGVSAIHSGQAAYHLAEIHTCVSQLAETAEQMLALDQSRVTRRRRMAESAIPGLISKLGPLGPIVPATIAAQAYAVADAMIALDP